MTSQLSRLNQARDSLRQLLVRSRQRVRHLHRHSPHLDWQTVYQTSLNQLSTALDKLEQEVIRIAAFGLVSRGKSAVLNGLLGQKVFPTGPLHGVTQWPRSVCWSLENSHSLQVELIDTPGLDEIDGQARAEMARDVAQQADLILFVIAGDLTRTEYQALLDLRQAHKPLIVVFNKMDLYPECDRQAIYQKLQTLGAESDQASVLPFIGPTEIVGVAAEPSPLQVRVEWPDGRVTEEWESPPPQVDALRQKIQEVLQREGADLLALNALIQAQHTSTIMARTTLSACQEEADALIWRYARYKSLAVAINPIALLDVLGGAIADLALIRALARLYGLPMTSYQAGKLWRTIVFSSGGVVLSELMSSALLGLGKSSTALDVAVNGGAGLPLYTGAAIAQGALAGYGLYAVGLAAQRYLEQGCSWGASGPSTQIQSILAQVEPHTLMDRLRDEITDQLNRESSESNLER